MKYEVRFSADVTADPTRFVGYAARWYDPQEPGTEYRLSGNLVERISPGAFRDTLADGHNIRGVYSHEVAANLGSTKAGTLKLQEDGRGLRFEMPYDATDPDHARAMAKVKRGEMGASFSFLVRENGQRYSKGVRTLMGLDLEEITLTTSPAYEATITEARSKVQSEYDAWERTQEILLRIEKLTNR